jgi:uncharacterized membrane protein YphA (DoxX/SURF4 family)
MDGSSPSVEGTGNLTARATVGVSGSWWGRNAHLLKTAFRVAFGILWLIDGLFKFAPGFADQFSVSGDGQPAWLQGWFNFWATQVANNPAFWVYLVGTFEISLGLALIFGFMRKIAYICGAVLSLFIWAVPEAFGGPYGPNQGMNGTTDPGTGVVYAMVFLMLIVINSAYGPSRLSLDYAIEQRWRGWKLIAEFAGDPVHA